MHFIRRPALALHDAVESNGNAVRLAELAIVKAPPNAGIGAVATAATICHERSWTEAVPTSTASKTSTKAKAAASNFFMWSPIGVDGATLEPYGIVDIG